MKVNENTVAICMATFNGGKYIRDQLESIIHQSYEEWVLFIRDDGSTDDTVVICKEYENLYKEKINIIHDENLIGGSSKANFAAILNWVSKKYNFNYFMFSDQDDVWMENKILVSMNRMHQLELEKEGPILVHTDLKVVDHDLNTISDSFFKYRSIDPDITSINRLLIQNNITGCTMLWNNKMNELFNLSNDSIAMHDWWMTLVAACFGRISVVNEPTILYRQHEKNVVGASRTNSIGYVVSRIKNIDHIKRTLKMSIIQANYFYDTYKFKLRHDDSYTINEFCNLKKQHKLAKLINVNKNKFYKQGLVQIIGELIFI